MIAFLKKTCKVCLVGAVLLGGAGVAVALIAGEGRTRAVVEQVHGKVLHSIDDVIDDPAALRSQLREMEREYPERIAQVRGDLAELNEQVRQLERDKAISLRVVELAEADLAPLEEGIHVASATRTAGDTGLRLSAVKCGERVMSFDRALTRVNQIKSTRVAYANRAADADHDLKYLRQQSQRLEELLLQLENERAQFQTQISALARQVDAIARNERLIGLLEKRNKTIQECSRYEAVSLDQITGRLAELRSRQEAELEFLANAQSRGDYEDVARMQIANESLDTRLLEAEQRVFELDDLDAVVSR